MKEEMELLNIKNASIWASEYLGKNVTQANISYLINNEKIIIPNTITSIGDNAFGLCYSLTSIEIPNSVTSIGYSAFSACNSLKSIEIPNSVTSIERHAFYGCGKLKSIIVCSDNPYLVKKDGEWLLNLPNGAGIEDLEINIKE